MTVFRTTDLSLAAAIRDIVLDSVREDDNTPLTPQTTLSQDAALGDTQAVVTDPAQFGPGMLFSFYDDMGEEDIPISGEWDGTNPVLFDFTKLDYQGLRFAHSGPHGSSAGARVGTNLFTEAPNAVDSMLQAGFPLVFIVTVDQKDVVVANRQIEPVFTMHIEYWRRLVQVGRIGTDTGIDSNVWTMRQQRLCRADMEVIAHAIRSNTTLTTAKGEHCIMLGDPLNPNKERFSKQWQKIIGGTNVQHFVGTGDFSVRGFREVFFGDAF